MKKRFVRYKIYYDRARGYIGAVQFLMLAVVLAKQFGLKLGVFGSIGLVISFFFGCLVIGYLDTRLGIRAEENKNSNEQNPQIIDINNKINWLCEEFKKNKTTT